MTAEQLFKKLEDCRLERDLDIVSFCKLMGFGKTAYYNWRQGNAPKGVEDTLKLLNFLEISSGNAFLFRDTFYNTFSRIKKKDPALAADFIEAILKYAFTGETPPESSPIWKYDFTTIQFQIDMDMGRA